MAFPDEAVSYVATLESNKASNHSTFLYQNGDPKAASYKPNGDGISDAKEAREILRGLIQRLDALVSA